MDNKCVRACQKLIAALTLLLSLLISGCESAEPAEWRTIPLMPGATVLESEEDMIVFEIASPLPEIGRYYVRELEEAGWTYLGLGEGVGGLFLVHSRGAEFLEISAYSSVDVEHTRVVISLR
jgi:hypothetical protein